MSDMIDSIKPKSIQLNYDDFIGRESLVIKITKVTVDKTEQPVSVFYEKGETPYMPSKSMRRVIVACWGDKKESYIGRSLKLFGNPKIKYSGKEAGGIQISELSHIDTKKTIRLTVAKGRREDFTVSPLVTEAPLDDKETKAFEWVKSKISSIDSCKTIDDLDDFTNKYSDVISSARKYKNAENIYDEAIQKQLRTIENLGRDL